MLLLPPRYLDYNWCHGVEGWVSFDSYVNINLSISKKVNIQTEDNSITGLWSSLGKIKTSQSFKQVCMILFCFSKSVDNN